MLRNPRGTSGDGRSRIAVPWFALGFIACAGLNSLGWLPSDFIEALKIASQLMLAAAMAALGLDTTLARLRRSGPRVFALGLMLFAWLICGGALINRALST